MKFRPRFSLRTLFIAFTAIGLLLGAVALWYRIQDAEYHRQLELADKLQQQGSTVGWGPHITPNWLSWLGNSKKFRRINSVSTWQPQTITEEDLAWLSSLDGGASIAIPADVLLDDSLVAKLANVKTLKDLMILPPRPGSKPMTEQYYLFEMQPKVSSKLPGVNVVIGNISN